MAKCIVNTRPFGNPGDSEDHWGHKCLIGEDGTLTAEVLDELVDSEVAAGRVTVIESKKKKGGE